MSATLTATDTDVVIVSVALSGITIQSRSTSPQLSCSARMSYHSVRSSQTGTSSVVSPSKFQLVLQISKSLSSVAALVVLSLGRSSQTGPSSVVSPSKFQLVLQISKSLSSVALVCPITRCSARMSYHSVRSSQTGPSSVVSPSKFQLVLQISKSLSSVAALVCPITRYVQVRLALAA
ncbi:hypothetical protein J6590_089058 [Homalodisca vitripennis]|nr:hypothetical protein J6590_089058 [Homalodisca vitripennis]